MTRPPTIYEALRDRLGREPTNPELKSEWDRLLTKFSVERAEHGLLPHQKR